MKNILLTGVAGFIGEKTADVLLRNNYNVIGIDNLNDYYDIQLKEHRLKNLNDRDNFKFVKGDIENLSFLRDIFKSNKIDAVINLAARAGVRYSQENPFIYMSTNATGTLNLLELMKEFKISKFVLASTSSLYAGQKMPFVEDLPVNTPISPYAATKKAAEVTAYTYHYLYDIDVSIVRYFTVYGPAGRPDMSPFRFIKWIMEGTSITLYGDGTQARDFTYVDDIAEGTVKALKNIGYEIINLGGGNNPISINSMITKIENLTGKKAKIDYHPAQKTDMKETWANIDKAANLLNWSPKISFDEGLKRAIEWHRKNKDFVKSIEV